MGYAHGTKWSEKEIENEIRDIMHKAQIDYMPTHSLIFKLTGNYRLTNAIRRHGGTRYWADKLGLEVKSCDSETGYTYECECMQELISLGYDVELAKTRYPYDLIANGNIKIDVKCSNLYQCKHGKFYTFNLEKKMPTCDIFVFYCLESEAIKRAYIIPSCVLSGKTQLSIGEVHSKYDKYIDNWNVIKRYDDFYNSLIS